MRGKKQVILPVILNTLKGSPLLCAGLLLSVFGVTAFSLLPPLVLEGIVNTLVSGSPVGLSSALFYFAAFALSGLSEAFRETLITAFGQKITRGVRASMCRKLARLPAGYFVRNDAGVTVSRFVGDVDTLETLFTSGIAGLLTDVLRIAGIITVVFIKSPGLGLLLVFCVPPLFFFTRRVQKQVLSAQLRNRAAAGMLASRIPEAIGCIRMIHSLHREKFMEKRYDRGIAESYAAVERANFCDALYSPVILAVSAIVIAVMMVFASTGGAAQSFFGISVGTAVAVIAYVGRVFEPLESIGMEIQSVQSAVAGVRRIGEFLSEPERGEADSTLSAAALSKNGLPAVEFSCVSFGYDEEKEIFKDVSFKVGRGETAVLAGRTGAGKSTALKLLTGFYAPAGGSVKIFGADAEKIPDSEKRRLFGYVEQSFRPVPGTVYDQIAVFDTEITAEDVRTAAESAGIDGAIKALPQGYGTPYSEGIFSMGQRQQLAIARAVAAKPEILLLDEITANLDSETEKRVLDALKAASRERTVISVSHRLYTSAGERARVIHFDGKPTVE